MKGRSQRMPQAEPPDDWGDGSWTVDCSCGVTFDDGEEMVSCDECGVWVHTRCSRYVRGEVSFACHNCKAAARRLRSASHISLPDDTEETEVAQLLVELPTKTDVCPPLPPPPPLPPASASGPHRRRLWGEIPLEDRVHVQGIPGGDPGLFEGLSSVFTSQLWKCTGYVPKKLNFQYKEFPCWEEEEKKKEGVGKKGEEEAENPANRGADVLFALSKQISPYVPVKKFETTMKHEDEGKVPSGSRSLSCRKKDRSKLRTFGPANLGKKKARSIADKIVGDNKKRGSIPSVPAKKFEFQKDKNLQVEETTNLGPKSEDKKEEMLLEGYITGQAKGMGHNDKPKHLTADKGMSSDQRTKEANTMGMQVKVEKFDQLETVKTENSSKIDLASRGGKSNVAKESSIDEVSSRAMYYLKQPKDESNFEGHLAKVSSNVVMDSGASKSAVSDIANGCKESHSEPVLPGSNDAVTPSTKLCINGVKSEGADDLSTGNQNFSASRGAAGKLHVVDCQPPAQLLNQLPENIQDMENKSSFPSQGHRSQDVRKECNELKEAINSRICEPRKHSNQVEDSIDRKGSLEIGHGLKNFDEATNSKSQDLNKLVPGELNLAVGVIKDSTSFAPVISKLSVLGINTSTNGSTSSSGKASHLTKQVRAKTNMSGASKKESTATPAVENMEVVSETPAKGQSKVSTFSVSKTSQTSRTSYNSTTELMVSDSKEELPSQSLKASGKVDTTAILCSDNVVGSWQSQVASGQIKPNSPNPAQRTEKSHQPSPFTSARVSSSSMLMHPSAPSNAATNLSDEELALLLHQELNSSPRVPRVPRMRQAAGVQLSATTGMSALSKRPVSAGKDQVSVFRRKNKEDTLRDTSRNSQELNDESRRKNRIPSFSDHKRQQISVTTEKKKESQSRPSDLMSMKNVALAPSEGEKSDPFSPSEISEQNTSVACSSSGDIPRDDNNVIVRTLPGLIDEIMAKDKHITYEELCNAVRPHWHDLRKPNGERYAYPSYLHAVHDCLRNRSEWAHLIDQGPKNSSKKRRKVDLDSDMPTVESESEKVRARSSKEEDNAAESHREDVPKGKRKARKRRRLQLRGTGVEDDRKRHSRVGSDYYPSAFSHSSNEGNESLFSEDEIQGAGPHAAGTETSSSSSDDSS